MNKQEAKQLCRAAAAQIDELLSNSASALRKTVGHTGVSDNVIEFFSALLSAVFGQSDTKIVLTHSYRNYPYNTSSSSWIISNDKAGFKMVITLRTYMTLHRSSLPAWVREFVNFIPFVRKRTLSEDMNFNAKVNYELTGYLGTKRVWTIADIVKLAPITVHNTAWIYDANKIKQRVENYENEWREWYFGKNSDICRT